MNCNLIQWLGETPCTIRSPGLSNKSKGVQFPIEADNVFILVFVVQLSPGYPRTIRQAGGFDYDFVLISPVFQFRTCHGTRIFGKRRQFELSGELSNSCLFTLFLLKLFSLGPWAAVRCRPVLSTVQIHW